MGSRSFKLIPYSKKRTLTAEEYFHIAVDKNSSEAGCWLWLGNKLKAGYGSLHHKEIKDLAHRYSHKLYKGEIPKGMFVCHTCDNPSCVNPDHLFIETHQNNMKDMKWKKRSRIGEISPLAKYSNEDIQALREYFWKNNPSFSNISNLFNIPQSTVFNAITRNTFKSLPFVDSEEEQFKIKYPSKYEKLVNTYNFQD